MRKSNKQTAFCHRSGEITAALQWQHCTLKHTGSPSTGVHYSSTSASQQHALLNLLHKFTLVAVVVAALCITDLRTSAAQTAPTDNAQAKVTKKDSTKGKSSKPVIPEGSAAQTINNNMFNMQEIAKQAEADAAVWLPTANGTFLALYERARTGYPQGAVLILHAEGEHLNWRQSAQYIRLNLPDWGWATLTIELPDPALPSIPERPNPADNESSESTNDSTPIDSAKPKPMEPAKDANAKETTTNPETAAVKPATAEPVKPEPVNPEILAQQRLQAALNYLHEQGQFNLSIIGIGVNAARAAYFIQQLTPDPKKVTDNRNKPFQALLLLNARNTLPNSDPSGPQPSLPAALNDPSMPILDLYFGTDIRDATETKQRLYHARRKKYRVYQQLQLPESTAVNKIGDNSGSDLLLRRIRGFLQHYMRGMELPGGTNKRLP